VYALSKRFIRSSLVDIARLGRRLPLDERDQSVRHLPGRLRDLLCHHAAVHQQFLVVDRRRRRVRTVLRVQLLVHARHSGGTHTVRPVHHGVRFDVAVPRYRQFTRTAVGR